MTVRRPKKAKPSVLTAIDGLAIAKKLTKHVLSPANECEMTPSQVTAATALLKKVIPDLAAHKVDVQGAVTIEVLHVASHKTPE
jgi:hypothetical protein